MPLFSIEKHHIDLYTAPIIDMEECQSKLECALM